MSITELVLLSLSLLIRIRASLESGRTVSPSETVYSVPIVMLGLVVFSPPSLPPPPQATSTIGESNKAVFIGWKILI